MHGSLSEDLVPYEGLTAHPANANNGDIEEIKASLQKHGCYRRVVVSATTGNILAGHHLAIALHELGSEIPIQTVDADPAMERSILAADNKTARLGRMDVGAEIALLRQIKDDDGDLRGTGYTEHDLVDLMEQRDTGLNFGDPEVQPDSLQENECPECGHQWVGSSAPDIFRGVKF